MMSAHYDPSGRADAVSGLVKETLKKVESWLIKDNVVPTGFTSTRAAEILIVHHMLVIAQERGGDGEMSGLLLMADISMKHLCEPETAT